MKKSGQKTSLYIVILYSSLWVNVICPLEVVLRLVVGAVSVRAIAGVTADILNPMRISVIN